MIRNARADREAQARCILEAAGLSPNIRSLGSEGEIAAVAAPTSSLEALRGVAPGLRSLGYRYVAIDLADALTGE